MITVITEDEIVIGGDFDSDPFGSGIAGGSTSFLGKVRLSEGLVINVNMALADGEVFIGKSDDTLDKFIFEIGRGFEDDNVAAFR